MIFPGFRFLPSPNCSSREGECVSAVVVHHISLPPGEFGGPHVLAFFQNRLDPDGHPYFREAVELKVSAHFFIDRLGVTTQLVDTDLKAWHAGVSELEGRRDVNRFSVGIELEGDEVTPYTDPQYEALVQLLKLLRRAHSLIPLDRIVGHDQIAPGRKRDPGPLFDWKRVRNALADAPLA